MRDIRIDESYSFVFRVFYVFVSVVGSVDVRDETMRPVVHCVEGDHEELVRDGRADRQPWLHPCEPMPPPQMKATVLASEKTNLPYLAIQVPSESNVTRRDE